MIPVNEPLLTEREHKFTLDCLRSGWVSSAGEYLERFERDWARICDRKHGIAVSNGTVALQLAVAVLQPPPAAEIIMPSFTIMSCALAAVYNGCKPVLVDCDPRTWCLDVDAVEGRVTDDTIAIMPVHIYGHPVDMDPILEVAARHGLAVIEDAAEAHGAEYQSGRLRDEESWVRCGSMGTVSTFSFYANKLVTTGEGGMLLTDDNEVAERARSLRNLAFQPDRRFVHDELGFNFRLTNLQAALGVAQIERFEDIVGRKRAMARRYNRGLGDIVGLVLPPSEPWARSVYWMYGIVLDDALPFDASEFARRLASAGVETRPFFVGLHEQPALRKRGWFTDERFPNTEQISQRGLYLPSGLATSDHDIDRVIDSVRASIDR